MVKDIEVHCLEVEEILYFGFVDFVDFYKMGNWYLGCGILCLHDVQPVRDRNS